MSASATLEQCRAIGVRIWADGERLRFQVSASAPPPDTLLADLRTHKAELLALLAANAAADHETILDWHDEHRAILQFDEGMAPGDAKREAWALTQARFGLPASYRLD